MRFTRFSLMTATTLFAGSMAVSEQAHPGRASLSADEIIDRALERASWVETLQPESNHTFTFRATTERLDRNGQVKKREQHAFLSIPIDGVSFQRLVEKDRKPLEDSELEEEGKRERKFRQALARGEDPRNEDEDRIVFNEELIGRYDVELDGIEDVRGRPAYVISFRPKSDDLPVKRRIDRALNKAEGKIWVDTDLFEISRVEFELTKKVRIWWGLLGSMSAVRGRMERARVADGIWFPASVDLYIKGRIFLSNLHSRESLRWSDFKAVEAADSESAGP